jgi:hypothetical protein
MKHKGFIPCKMIATNEIQVLIKPESPPEKKL